MSVGEPQDAPPPLLAETDRGPRASLEPLSAGGRHARVPARGAGLSPSPLPGHARPDRSRYADLAGHEQPRGSLPRRVDRDRAVARCAARSDAEPVLPDVPRRGDHGGRDAVLPAAQRIPGIRARPRRRRRGHLGAHVDSLPVLALESGRARDPGERDAARDRGRAPPRLSRRVRRVLCRALRRHAAARRARRARGPRFLGPLARRTCWCSTRCPSARAPRGCAPGLPPATGRSWPRSIACASMARRARRCRLLAAATALWSEDGHVEAMRARLRERKDMADRLLGGFPGYYRPPCGFFLWLEVDDGVALTQRLWRDFALQGAPGRVSHPTRCGRRERGARLRQDRPRPRPRYHPGGAGAPRRSAGRRCPPGGAATRRAASPSPSAGSGLKLARRNLFEPDSGLSQERHHDEAIGIGRGIVGGVHRERARRQDARHDQAAGPARLRRQPEPAGILGGRQPGQLDGTRRRHLQGDRGVHPRRRQEDQVGAAQRIAALHRAAVGRDRHPVAQHHVDADARRVAGPRVHRRHLLRRPGLHGDRRSRRSRAPSN